MQLKPIFIQKEVPALVLSRQTSKIFNNNFFKERKKKNCYKKNKSKYATFHVTLPRFLYFSTVHSENRLYIVLSVENKSLKVVNNASAIGL